MSISNKQIATDLLLDVLEFEIKLNYNFIIWCEFVFGSLLVMFIFLFLFMLHMESRYKKLKYKIKYSLNV